MTMLKPITLGGGSWRMGGYERHNNCLGSQLKLKPVVDCHTVGGRGLGDHATGGKYRWGL